MTVAENLPVNRLDLRGGQIAMLTNTALAADVQEHVARERQRQTPMELVKAPCTRTRRNHCGRSHDKRTSTRNAAEEKPLRAKHPRDLRTAAQERIGKIVLKDATRTLRWRCAKTSANPGRDPGG